MILSADYLKNMDLTGLCLQELDDLVQVLYDTCRHLRAKEHLEGLTAHEKKWLQLADAGLVTTAKCANRQAGHKRWRETAPNLAESFARECDSPRHTPDAKEGALKCEPAAPAPKPAGRSAVRKRADGPPPAPTPKGKKRAKLRAAATPLAILNNPLLSKYF